MINVLHENPGVVIMELERNKAVQIQNWVWQREIFESWFQRNVSRNPYYHRSQTEFNHLGGWKSRPMTSGLWDGQRWSRENCTSVRAYMMSTTLNGSLTLEDWRIEHRFGSVPHRAKCPASLSWPSLSNEEMQFNLFQKTISKAKQWWFLVKPKSCWWGTMINGVLSWPPRLLLKPDLSSLPMSASPESCLLLLILNNSCAKRLLIGPRCGLSLHLSETDSVYPDYDLSVVRSVISSNFCFSGILFASPNLNKILQKQSWHKSYWTQMTNDDMIPWGAPCIRIGGMKDNFVFDTFLRFFGWE